MLRFTIAVNKLGNMSADGAGGATPWLRPFNARSIALSVLLGTHPPELPARSFVALSELFGIPGGTMRTALSRLVRSGDVIGVDGQYRLAGRLLDRQRAQDVGRRSPSRGWDGRWHTIVAAPDQRDQAVRRQFRAVMANDRFGELRPDIWMRPSNLTPPSVQPDWIMTTGDVDGIGPERLVARLWDLPAVAADARRLLDALHDTQTTADWSDPRSIPRLFTLSAAVVRFLRNDPLLPPALTVARWPVDELRPVYDQFERDHLRLLQAFLRRGRQVSN